MAEHRREQILTEVMTALDGLTTTGSNVFRGRVRRIPETSLPALLVYQGNDVVLNDTFPFTDRDLQVRVVAVVQGVSEPLDPTFNLIEAEVITAWMADPRFGLSFVISSSLSGTEDPTIEESGALTGTMAITFSVKYRHSFTDPTS